MAGLLVDNFADRSFCSAMCDVLQQHIDKNVVIVKVEMIQQHDTGMRRIVFWYSKISEGITARQAGKPDSSIPRYPVEVSVPVWNTHISADLILAKFALVR
ncbi:hypothetical protein [Methylobacterium sp.]|uniref:hypothetical protein n=1 Tax=Methylobacterium sp. TaxID=409 RepID=UPI000C3FAE8B|nr:hypothetical protein [Methylobacterium sp.]MBP33222.1 hypothetical protein [Methylobacterium sp.]